MLPRHATLELIAWIRSNLPKQKGHREVHYSYQRPFTICNDRKRYSRRPAQSQHTAQNQWPSNLIKVMHFHYNTAYHYYTTLIFVHSGYINLRLGSLRPLGSSGFDWSCSAVAHETEAWGDRAYHLSFDSSTVYPSDSPYHRWDSFPVRCLVILIYL